MKSLDISVLILEDNHQMRMLMTTILNGLGIRQVSGAECVDEAIDRCLHNQYDIFLVDQLLRGRDSGLRFVKWLRMSGESRAPMAPVITISSFSERSRIIEAINAGVDEFLVKPLRPVDMARRIQAVGMKRRKFVRTGDYFGPCRRRLPVPANFAGPYRRADDMVDQDEDLMFELD